MADEQTNRAALIWQADYCADNAAPIVQRLCESLARSIDRSSITGRRVLDWPGEPKADALPLRLAAPFHFLARRGDSPDLARFFAGATTDPAAVDDVVRATIAAHDAAIAAWLDGPPQTNEAGRSGVLMSGLLVLADRFGRDDHGVARRDPIEIELLEIGSSAGLNLLIDRYRFDLGGVRIGPHDSPVSIHPQWRGPPPPAAAIHIASVRGVDIAPIDLSDGDAAEHLMAYVWIDAADRIDRAGRAIAMARAAPPRLDRGDAADWVEARLAEPQRRNVLRVLMHSVVWQYLEPAGQRRIEAAMADAAARATIDRPLAWVRYEADRVVNRHSLRVASWPGHGQPQRHATAHPHGAWIEWSGDDA